MKFTIEGKQLSKNIDSWSKRRSAVVTDLQTLAVSCVCHAIAHGDVTYINKLDEACRDGIDGKGKTASGLHLSGLRKYFEDQGPVSFKRRDAKAGTAEGFTFSKDKHATLKASYDANPDGFRDNLLSIPYYHAVSQAEWQGMDVPERLRSMLAAIKRVMTNEDKANHPKNDFTGVKELEAIVKKLPKKEKKAAA